MLLIGSRNDETPAENEQVEIPFEATEIVLLERQCTSKPLIFVPGKRVPVGFSARAIPAGVAAFHSHTVMV